MRFVQLLAQLGGLTPCPDRSGEGLGVRAYLLEAASQRGRGGTATEPADREPPRHQGDHEQHQDDDAEHRKQLGGQQTRPVHHDAVTRIG